MARHKVLIAVEVVFDGDYYEPSELVPVTWGWISGTLTDRDDLQSARVLGSLVIDPESKARITFDGNPEAGADHWAPQPPALSPQERQFLTFALDQAGEEMSLRDGFTDADTAALEKFRSWAGEAE